MSLTLLYKIQGIEMDIKKIEKQRVELLNQTDADRLKAEYKRLKAGLDKAEEKLRTNSLQLEVKENEIKNLQNAEKNKGDWEEKFNLAQQTLNKLKEEADEANKNIETLKKKLQFISKKYFQLKEANEKSLEQLQIQEDALRSGIEKIRPELDETLLPMYNRLKIRYDNAVALVENRVCTGCNVEIPGIIYEAIKAGTQGIKCESCGRLLYDEKRTLENLNKH